MGWLGDDAGRASFTRRGQGSQDMDELKSVLQRKNDFHGSFGVFPHSFIDPRNKYLYQKKKKEDGKKIMKKKTT